MLQRFIKPSDKVSNITERIDEEYYQIANAIDIFESSDKFLSELRIKYESININVDSINEHEDIVDEILNSFFDNESGEKFDFVVDSEQLDIEINSSSRNNK